MKPLIKICILLIFLLSQSGLTAQQWIRPKPLMTNTILRTFIEMQLVYPTEALQNKEEGTVVIGFSTNEKGKVEERHIIQSVSPLVDESALKIFDLILWHPAERYGKAVSCPASGNNGFPIKFNIRKYKKLVKKRGYDKLPQPFSPIDSTKTVYTKKQVEHPPAYLPTAGFQTLNDFIYGQISYPEEAVKYNISGLVKLAFVVESSGLPSNLLIKETVGGGCTEEAIEVVQQLRWIPGILKNRGVRTKMELSIQFRNPAHLKNKEIPNQQNSGI